MSIFEDIAGGVQDRIDDIEHCFDPSVAPLSMVRWLGSWMGVEIDSSFDPVVQRLLVSATGRSLSLRGTPRGMRQLVADLTGGDVIVKDEGGVIGPADAVPSGVTITVYAETTGKLTEAQLHGVIKQDCPVGSQLEVVIGSLPRS